MKCFYTLICHRLIIFLLIIFLFIVSFIFSSNLYAGETNFLRLNHFALGVKGIINFSELPQDIGFGLSATSPFFFYDWTALRAEADFCSYRGVPLVSISSNEIWGGYSAYKIGIVASAGKLIPNIRPYFEMGWIGVIPNETITTNGFTWGIYGLFGFDLMFDPTDFRGYYIEVGSTALFSGGKADNFQGDPTFAEGIIISAGCRFYF